MNIIYKFIAITMTALMLYQNVSTPSRYAEINLKTYKSITEGDVISGELTFYDVCMKCCGKTNGVTASGLIIQNGTDPEIPVASCNWLPFGTIVTVNGIKHVIADRGGKGLSTIGRLDIFEPKGHEEALRNGRQKGMEIIIVSLP